MVTVGQDLCTFMVISGSFLLGIGNISDKICREYQNTHFMFNKFFFNENRAVYETMRKNMAESGRPQITIKYSACAFHAGCLRLQKHTHTQNKYYLLLLH